MKWSIVVLCLILMSSLVVAEYESEFLDVSVTVDDVNQFQYQFKQPNIVYAGSEFEMILIPVLNASALDTADIRLYKEGKLLPGEGSIIEFQGNQQFLQSWKDTISEETNYKLEYTLDGVLSYQKFTIKANEKIIVDRKRSESIYVPQAKTENQKNNLINLLAEKDFEYTLDEFIAEEVAASKLINLDKTVFEETLIYNDGSQFVQTVVVINIETTEILSDVKIIETIPKDFAFHVSELSYDVEPIVLEEDPIIMWHLQGVENQTITYSVQGNASLTGNTILLTTVIEETQIQNKKSSKGIWLPLLLIPLIAGIIIFFSKFNNAPKKRRRY